MKFSEGFSTCRAGGCFEGGIVVGNRGGHLSVLNIPGAGGLACVVVSFAY